MRSRRFRLAAVALAAVAGLSVLAACGDGTGAASVSIRALQAAAQNTQQTESRQYSFTLSTRGGRRDIEIHGTAVAAGDGSRARATVDLGSLGTLEELVVDHDVYISVDGLGGVLAPLAKGKAWIKIDVDELAEYLPQMGGAGQANPGDQGLQALEGLSGDVERVGDDTVAGRHAVHYRAEIDDAKVADALPDPSSKAASALRKIGTVPADVWIDDHDRVVKLRFAMSGGALGGSGSGTVEMTLEVTAFGVPVDVQAPPADQVLDLTDMLGGAVGGILGGGSSGGGTQI